MRCRPSTRKRLRNCESFSLRRTRGGGGGKKAPSLRLRGRYADSRLENRHRLDRRVIRVAILLTSVVLDVLVVSVASFSACLAFEGNELKRSKTEVGEKLFETVEIPTDTLSAV